MIKTGCWFTPLPPDHLRVGISRATPRSMPKGYRMFRELAPGEWFNRIPDPVKWAERYRTEVLSRLDPQEVVGKLRALAEGRTVVLCCFEQPPPPDKKWCHRALVSVWLQESMGLEVLEIGHESCGCGRQHPKLAPVLVEPQGEQALDAAPYRLKNRLLEPKDFDNDLRPDLHDLRKRS